MRIITLNCNGIRAAARKGFFNWLATVDADIVCLQETKAQVDQLTDPIFHPENFHSYYFDAERKGYAGTALYCRAKPLKITKGLGLKSPITKVDTFRAISTGSASHHFTYRQVRQEKKDRLASWHSWASSCNT